MGSVTCLSTWIHTHIEVLKSKKKIMFFIVLTYVKL